MYRYWPIDIIMSTQNMSNLETIINHCDETTAHGSDQLERLHRHLPMAEIKESVLKSSSKHSVL